MADVYPSPDWEETDPGTDPTVGHGTNPTDNGATTASPHGDATEPLTAGADEQPPVDCYEPPPEDDYAEPPVPDYDDFDGNDTPPPPGDTRDFGRGDNSGDGDRDRPARVMNPARALEALHRVIRGTHGMRSADARTLLHRTTTDRVLVDLLDEDTQRRYLRLTSGLIGETTILHEDTSLDLFDISAGFARDAWEDLKRIRTLPAEQAPKDPHKFLTAEIDVAQMQRAHDSAKVFADACLRREPTEALIELHRSIESPTRQQSVLNADFVRSGTDWITSYNASNSASSKLRLSSGLPSVDLACTEESKTPGVLAEPKGTFGCGEFWVFPAGTGNGKSAFARPLATSMALDLINWGLTDAKVLLAFVEESAKIILRASRTDEGARYNHVSDNLMLANIGASRVRLTQAVYKCVMDAEDQAMSSGRPITHFLPWVIMLDYIGGPKANGESDAAAIETNADLLLRGFAAWNEADMELFSGLSYSQYSGRKWPEGMDDFQPAVICFAQLLGKVNKPQKYTDGKDDVTKFTVENADGSLGWAVRAGDLFVPEQSDVRGSSVLMNHATGVVFLHRSRPHGNQPVLDPVTGKKRLSDTRARLIFGKTRNAVSKPFADMEFDSNPEGSRGMFYDRRAIEAMKRGFLTDVDTDVWTQDGDPMLPLRAKVSPFNVRY